MFMKKFYKFLKQEIYEKFYKLFKQSKASKQGVYEKF